MQCWVWTLGLRERIALGASFGKGKRERGKVGAVGKGPTRLRLPCTTQITYAMGSARKEKGREGERPKERKQIVPWSVLGVSSKFVPVTPLYWMECGGGHGGGCLRSFAFVHDDDLDGSYGRYELYGLHLHG